MPTYHAGKGWVAIANQKNYSCPSLLTVSISEKLRRLADRGCYLLPDGANEDLPWASQADLPLVEVSVNGVEEHFLLDTGVCETLIDPALASSGSVETDIPHP